MASWLICMDSSAGKSIVHLWAIYSGLHAVTQARSPRWGLLRPFQRAGEDPSVRAARDTGWLVLDVPTQPALATSLAVLGRRAHGSASQDHDQVGSR
jgi:hypothetical protein